MRRKQTFLAATFIKNSTSVLWIRIRIYNDCVTKTITTKDTSMLMMKNKSKKKTSVHVK